MTPAGVVAFKFRCLEDHDHKALGHGKYDSPGGQSIRLYNARVLAEGGAMVLVCEGELDALVAQDKLGVPAVGTWGTNWLEHHSRCFSDYDRVIVVGDNDLKDAGANPGLKHARKVQDAIPGAEMVLPPPGMDLSSWLLSEGVDVVRDALSL